MTSYSVTQAQVDQLRSTLATAQGQVDQLTAIPITPPDGGGGGGGGGAGGPPVNAGSFSWGNTGQVITIGAQAGTTYAFGYAVPVGWAGQIFHEVLESSTPIGSVHVRLWDSLEPGGPAIAGTEYDGAWIGGSLPAPTWHPAPGDYFFNVLVHDKSGQVGAHQNHYP